MERTGREEREPEGDERGREQAARDLGGEAVADDERLGRACDPGEERGVGDGLAVAALRVQEGQVRDEDGGRQEQRQDGVPAAAVAPEEPGASAATRNTAK